MMPPQSLNSMVLNQVFGPTPQAQPVVHLNQMPFLVRNHTISAALREHCARPTGVAVNFTVTRR